MENLNAERIKNNIEACIERECENCSYDEQTSCKETMLCDALALINSQEQRIKELTEEVEWRKKQYLSLVDSHNRTCNYLNTKEVEMVKLTEENAEVKENWQKLKSSYDNNDKEWREAYADSQSKWEKAYEKLELTLEGVMHFVDKWLDGAELEYDEVNRAITMREKTLQIVENLAEENERLRELDTTKEIEKEIVRRETKADTVQNYRECLHREFASLGVKDKFNKEFFLTKADQIAKTLKNN